MEVEYVYKRKATGHPKTRYKRYARGGYHPRTLFAPNNRYRGGPNGSGGELKFHDIDLNDAPILSGGTITATVNIIPQGITEITRIGRKCTIKQIGWRYQLTLPEVDAQDTPEASDQVRVMMFVDKQCNGATALSTDILESANFQSYRNLANIGRFTILMDKTYAMNYLTLASDGAAVVSSASVKKFGTFYKKCNIPLEFNAALGVLTEIRSNNIGVLLLSDSGKVNFTSKIRLRFSDS